MARAAPAVLRQGAVIAVTHDRYFLDHVAEWIAEVDRGRLYPYEGNYSTYLEKKEDASTSRARRTRSCEASQGRARMGALEHEGPSGQVQGAPRPLRRDGAEAERTKQLDFDEIQIPAGPRLGSLVIDAKDLTKGFGDRMLIDGLSFSLPPNGIVGVIGPNGVGKTTLFKTIVGLEPLDGGELKIGETVKLSYVDQNRGGIDPEKNLWEVVSDGLDFMKVGKTEMPSRAYVSEVRLQGPGPAEEGGDPVGR